MKLIFILLIFSIPVLLFGASPKKTKVPVLSFSDLKIPCEKEVLGTLGRLEVPNKWIQIKSDAPSEELKIFISKTSKPDVNLELGIAQGRSQITRTHVNEKIIYQFEEAKKCTPLLRTELEPKGNGGKLFKDADLAQIIEKNPTGTVVFYTWSPSMNLSVQGLKEIRQLSKKLKFQLVPLIDPMTSDVFARDILRTQNLPVEALTKMDSNVLKRKLALIHFPTLIALQNGQLTKLRPGYDRPDVLEKYLKSLNEKAK